MSKLKNRFSLKDVEVMSKENCHSGFLNIEKLHLKHRLFQGGWSEVLQRELIVKGEAVGILLFDSFRDEVVMVRQGSHIATTFHPEMHGDSTIHKYFADIVHENK